jgi:hypothetical protein
MPYADLAIRHISNVRFSDTHTVGRITGCSGERKAFFVSYPKLRDLLDMVFLAQKIRNGAIQQSVCCLSTKAPLNVY